MDKDVKTAVIEITGLVMYGLFTIHVALMTWLASPPQTEVLIDKRQTVIYEDPRLLTVCVIGAFAGAVLSVLIFPVNVTQTPESAVRRTAAKILASLLSGLIFSPMVVRYIETELNSDTLVFVAGTTSFLAVGVLDGLGPFLVIKLKEFLQKKAG